MRDLSMHVLDIAQNSIKARATRVSVSFDIDAAGWLRLTVRDDGCGMDAELLRRVQDPFTTTRTTRKVGLGVPMIQQSAVQTGGALRIESAPGKGTTLTATFDLCHVDCPPMGDMCDTLLTLVVLNPDAPEFLFTASEGDQSALFDTTQVRAALGGEIPLNQPDVVEWMKASIQEEFKPILEVQVREIHR